jgi:transcriptional regulator with XRE-family HTH domain
MGTKQNQQHIKDRCVALIRASGITQEQLANELGMSRSGVAQYWVGRTPIPMHHLEAFCDLVGSCPQFVITGRHFDVMQAYNALGEQEKAIVDRFLFPSQPTGTHPQKKTA